MIKSTKMIESNYVDDDEHIIIGDVLLHSDAELKPIRIIVQTPSIGSTERLYEDNSVPRIFNSKSHRKTFVQKMDDFDVKPSTNIFDQYSLLFKSIATKKVGQLHRTSDTMMTKLKSKVTLINAVRKNFSNEYAQCQITFF